MPVASIAEPKGRYMKPTPPPTKAEIIRTLHNLSGRLARTAEKMALYGLDHTNHARWLKHSAEMLRASEIATQWTEEMKNDVSESYKIPNSCGIE